MLSRSRKKVTLIVIALLVISSSVVVLALDFFLFESEKASVDKRINEDISTEAPLGNNTAEAATDTPATKEDVDVIQEEKPDTSDEKPAAEVTENAKPISTKSEYRVQAGDTLFLIARSLKLDVEDLKLANQLQSDHIEVGQVLKLSKATSQKPEPNPPQEAPNRGAGREDELYWLSRIIHAEAQGEPYEGMVAVGNVVLNRVKSNDFPDNVYDVIFDVQYGYTQFSPVIDGSIYNTPHEESIRAAKAALNGERPVGDALYFLNPRKATNFWIVGNREYFMTIGDHDFYH